MARSSEGDSSKEDNGSSSESGAEAASQAKKREKSEKKRKKSKDSKRKKKRSRGGDDKYSDLEDVNSSEYVNDPKKARKTLKKFLKLMDSVKHGLLLKVEKRLSQASGSKSLHLQMSASHGETCFELCDESCGAFLTCFGPVPEPISCSHVWSRRTWAPSRSRGPRSVPASAARSPSLYRILQHPGVRLAGGVWMPTRCEDGMARACKPDGHDGAGEYQ
eukprot:3500802-Rhodomonas_salina.3